MDKKMKIGINSRIYQQANTGIPYFIKKLYEELLSKNNYNYVFFQTNDKKTIGKTKIISWANKSFLYPIFDMFLVNRLASKEKINIFHGTSYILPFFKKKNIKYLVTIHDLSFKIFPKNHSKIFNIYYSLGVKRSLKNADKIISDSESTKKDIIKYYKTDSKKIKVIHLGVNNVFFKRDKRPRIIKEKYLFSITTHPRERIFLVF
jgi:glycosyltransferase involved in cell wall biosynthesis